MKSLYPIFPVTESHKENRNSSSFVKSPRRSRSLELLKNIKLLPILPRAMKMESNEIIIPIFHNTPITESLHRKDKNSSSFVKCSRRSRNLELLKNAKLLPIFRRAMKIESNEITCIRFFAILQLQNHSTEPQLIRRASQKYKITSNSSSSYENGIK